MLALALGLSACSLAEDVRPPLAGLGVAPDILSPPPAPSPTVVWQGFGRLDLAEGQSEEISATGTVRGQVVNGTGGEEVPAGLEVTLHAVEGEEEVYLPVMVYESTSDLGQVRVAQLHLVFLGPREGMVNVSQIWVFSNRGDEVVVPPQGDWLVEVVLPDGAQVMGVSGTGPDDRFAETAAGFWFSTAVLPGEGTAQLTVHFSLPYEGQLDLAQPMPLAVDSAVILVQEGEMRALGNDLVDAGSVSIGGMDLRQYLAGPFEPGDTLTVSLASHAFRWPVVVGGAALAAAVTAAVLRRLRLRGRLASVGALTSTASRECREALLQAMAELDDAFEAGGLPEAEYRARRQELKRQLMARMGERRD